MQGEGGLRGPPGADGNDGEVGPQGPPGLPVRAIFKFDMSTRKSTHDPHTSDMLTLFPPFPLSLWRNATGIDGAQRRERRVRRYWSPRIDGTPRFTWTTCKSLSPLYNNIPPTLIQLASLLAFLVIAQLKVSISMRGRATIV